LHIFVVDAEINEGFKGAQMGLLVTLTETGVFVGLGFFSS